MGTEIAYKFENTVKTDLFFDKKIANEWLDTSEAATYLKITTNALRILVYRRKVVFYKYGRRLRFRLDDLRWLLKKGA